MTKRRIGSTARLLALVPTVALGACASGAVPDYAQIRPVYAFRNAPTPVPLPRAKPAPADPAVQSRRLADRPRSDGTIMVLPGDTLYRLARRHKVDAAALVRVNQLADPDRLHVGQELRLPTADSPRTPRPAAKPAPAVRLQKAVVQQRVHRVRPGESLRAIAASYGLSWRALARANRLTPPYTIHKDQRLRIPPPGSEPAPRAPQPVKLRHAKAVIPSPRTKPDFHWPLSGPILSGFGTKGGGLHNDGINIAAESGQPIRAAEAGEVIYVGDDLKPFGQLMLIRHAGGYVTAYAHAERFVLAKGARVRRGEIIGRVGTTGKVRQAQLHFEIRRGADAVDPTRLLRQRTAGR